MVGLQMEIVGRQEHGGGLGDKRGCFPFETTYSTTASP